MDRSANATKEEMQQAIDILRARGDSAIETLHALRASMATDLARLDLYLAKLDAVDAQLKITSDDRKNNAVITARRILGDLATGKSDDEVLRMIGHNDDREL